MPAKNIKSSKINLLPAEMRGGGRIERLKSIFARTSFVVLGVYIILLVAVIGTNFFLAQKKAEADLVNAQLVRDIEGLKREEGLIQIVKNRVRLARDILISLPSAPPALLDEIISLLPPGSEIIEIKATSGKLVISASARDSFALGDFFDKIEEKKFVSVDLDSIARQANGGFSISLDIK